MMNLPSGTNGKHTLKDSQGTGLFAIAALTLVFLSMLSACGIKDTSDKPFPDAQAALTDYSSFYSKLSRKKSASTPQLIESAKEWLAIDSKVGNALATDSVLPSDSLNAERYLAIRDSILDTFDRLVDSKPRSLSDYLAVARNVKSLETDSASLKLSESLHRFYAQLDAVSTYGLDAKGTVAAYTSLLSRAQAEGFSSKEDVYSFLLEEDTAFRSFLERLPELGALDLDGIRDGTTAVMGDIVGLAASDSPILDTGEVVVLMTMRTSRRLLQNALQCIEDIRLKRVQGEDQSKAYQWMLVQPWVTFDSFAYSLMSDDQWQSLAVLASETPKRLAQIRETDFSIPMDELPGLLIKILISSL